MVRNPPEVLVIGLDGATWDIILPLVEAGELPAIASILRDGVWADLRSTTPPLTTSAWASFATGRDPSGHGIYSWDILPADSYARAIPSRAAVTGESIWEILDRHGIASGAYNVPMTYPPAQLREGFIVSCFGVPRSRDDNSWPPALAGELRREFGEPAVRVPAKWIDAGAFDIEAFDTQSRVRTEAALWLMHHHPVRVLNVNYMVTDQVAHYAAGRRVWPLKSGGEGDVLAEAYRIADRQVGALRQALPGDTTCLLASDHGFGPCRTHIEMNSLLERVGYLVRSSRRPPARQRASRAIRGAARKVLPEALLTRLRRARRRRVRPRTIDRVDWCQTQAFSWSIGGVVRLNVVGREPAGIVEPNDIPRVRRELAQALLDVELEEIGGRPVAEVVEGPRGDCAGQAPDLIAVPNYGLGCDFGPLAEDATPCLAKPLADYDPPTSGCHHPLGILAGAGPLVRKAARISEAGIADVAPTLLYLLGLPIPRAMTGRLIEEMVPEDVWSRRDPEYEETTDMPSEARVYTAEDEAALQDQLRDLGYFE